MKPRFARQSIVVGSLLTLSPFAAYAHPTLVRSTPAADAAVKAPVELSLRFSEEIEAVFNKIEVTDGAGAHFEDGKARLDGSDKTLLHLRLKPLAAGSYTVRWRVSGADSHKMEGSFGFKVAP